MQATELVYFPGCPHVAQAREQLGKAFRQANLAPVWVEYQTDDPRLPDYARGFGSPTILIDGRDVTGAAAGSCSDACRLYVDEAGLLSGVPTVREIVSALTAISESS